MVGIADGSTGWKKRVGGQAPPHYNVRKRAYAGLRELTLSANPAITCTGWARLAVAVAHSSQVRTLNLDYNPLGDHIASMLAVCVASSRTLEILDLEGTGLSNLSAQILLDMIQNYPTPLRNLVLSENNISVELQQQIADLLSEGEDEDESEGPGQDPPIREKGLKSNLGPGPHRVLLTSGLGDSLLAETEM
ncbi:hypothetical protein AB205_0171640 [Aquarana catesbeiana]|uniref:Leucine-rich repeat-containing protein 73 n=1 Tax=Aquarana catesbeiana TaxID=8400 RepID=A0A2G9R7K7_AQUCT|nr:hypothetical protein AB205_0171640 [Aquarana catesbeiana]